MLTSVGDDIPEPRELQQENCWVTVKEPCCTPTRSRGDYTAYPHMASAKEWRKHVRPAVEGLSKLMDRLEIYLRCPLASCSNQRGDYVNHIASSGCNGWHFKNLWTYGVGGIPINNDVIIEDVREMAWEQINIPGGAVRINHVDWMVKMWKGASPPPCAFGHRPQDVEPSTQTLPVSAPNEEDNAQAVDTCARCYWWPLIVQGAVDSFKSNLRIAEVPSQQLYCQLCEGVTMTIPVETHLMSAAHSENVACALKRFGANGNSLQESACGEEGFEVQGFQGMHGCVWLNHLTLQSGFNPSESLKSESSCNYAFAEPSPLCAVASGAASSETALTEADSEQVTSMSLRAFKVVHKFDEYLSLDVGSLVCTGDEEDGWVFVQVWNNGALTGRKGWFPKNYLQEA